MNRGYEGVTKKGRREDTSFKIMSIVDVKLV